MKWERKILGLAILAGIAFWVIDTIFDWKYKFGNDSFWHILVYDAPSHEFFIRPLVLLIFIAMGIFMARYVGQMRETEGRYHQFFNNVNDAIFVRPLKNREIWGKFSDVNAVGCQLFGYSKAELLQMTPADLTDPNYLPDSTSQLTRLTQEKHAMFETVAVAKDGRRISVELNCHLVTLQGEPTILSIVRDISQRQQSEEEIRRLASFPQLDPHPILEVDAAGAITFFNEATVATLERLGTSEVQAFLPPDLGDLLKTAQEKGATQFSREIRIGEALFTVFIYYVPQFKVARLHPLDITEIREAEEALRKSARQLRELTAQLLNVQEEERRRVSNELHDELGQALMVLKLQFSALHDHLRKDQQDLKNDCKALLQYLDQVIENVRRLSWDLSPRVLEQLGLASAVKHLLEQFGKHYGIQDYSVDLDEIDDLFPPRAQLTIYRIFQECLTNIGKHAQATQVSFAGKKQEGQVLFMCEDNGQGFEGGRSDSRQTGARGIGLATMAERARMLGGSLEVQSRKASGTRITFSVPQDLREDKDDDVPHHVGG
jgi:PAS domain S-box-containing protein